MRARPSCGRRSSRITTPTRSWTRSPAARRIPCRRRTRTSSRSSRASTTTCPKCCPPATSRPTSRRWRWNSTSCSSKLNSHQALIQTIPSSRPAGSSDPAGRFGLSKRVCEHTSEAPKTGETSRPHVWRLVSCAVRRQQVGDSLRRAAISSRRFRGRGTRAEKSDRPPH